MTLRRFGGFGAASSIAVGLVLTHAAPAEAQSVSPHQSMTTLTSSNGFGAVVYDATAYKITEFLEHPYQAQSSTTTSRNFATDSYAGVRIGAAGTKGTWFTSVKPTVIEYLPGTGIIHTQRTIQSLTLDEYDFMPMALAENASVMLVKVTQTGAAGPVDVYSLFNYAVGSGNPPGSSNEQTTYDTKYPVYYEWSSGVGITMAFGSLGAPTHHACGGAGASNNPWEALNAGADLDDDPGTGTTTSVSGATEGFQATIGTMASGATAWVGWVTALAGVSDAQASYVAAQTWVNGRALDKVLSDEQAAWAAWVTAAPSGTSTTEAAIQQQSQAILRMAQVAETGQGNGQILASLANTPPPASSTSGNWNISWVRDMAYATVALVKSGHYTEAKAALAYQMQANVGAYESYITGPSGTPVQYQISVCRYYGDGDEWSDSNSNGPNVEFDGFGLFLWALDEYVKASGDTAFLTASWASTIKPKVADVIVHLQESSGLMSPDSSIWEVHWNGQERHFTYTTAAAANGLCAASRLATLAGDSTSSTTYLTQGQKARDSLISSLRGPGGALGQSTEAIASGATWLDASVIEAINWGLVDPTGPAAQATMSAMKANLLVADGNGFMRDQNGQWYDSQEWVFVDLRSAAAFSAGGQSTLAASVLGWNTGQASDNFGEISELYDPATGNYEGSPPMAGFGAGAYILALADRGAAITPTCGAFAVETGGSDAGVDAGGGTDAGTDGGKDGGVVSDASSSGGDASASQQDATTDGRAASDAAQGNDSAARTDSGTSASDSGHTASRDAAIGPLLDGSVSSEDSGAGATSSSGGCGMSGVPVGRAAWSSWLLPLIGLALSRRRRRA